MTLNHSIRGLCTGGLLAALAGCGGGSGQAANPSGDLTIGNGPSTDGTIPGGAAGQTLSPESACVSDAREGDQLPVDLYFMVDKTGSMRCQVGPDGKRCSSPPDPPSTGPTRWSEVSAALNDFMGSPENAAVGAGIGFFPRPDLAAPLKGDSPPIACNANDYAAADVDVGALSDVAGAIITSISDQVPGGGTPTVASITGALLYAVQRRATMPSHRVAVIYATDGIPDGCRDNTIGGAVSVAKNVLEQQGIPTYVLGVGPQLESLNQIAAAGGSGQAYLIDTGSGVRGQFAAALHSIRSRLLTCDYHIPSSSSGPLDFGLVNVIAKLGDKGTATVLGQVKDKSSCDAGGWFYDDPSNPNIISLCPATCSPLLTNPTAHLQVLIGCQTAGEPIK